MHSIDYAPLLNVFWMNEAGGLRLRKLLAISYIRNQLILLHFTLKP